MANPADPAKPANLIRGRSLRMIDDENFDRALGRHELQPELFLQRGEDVWEVGVGLGRLPDRPAGSRIPSGPRPE